MTTTDAAPETERREFTHDEWAAEARARFGDNGLDWAFTCPRCGDVATARDFPAEMRERIGQECIGRHRGVLPELAADRGCNWAAYGFIPGPWAVTMPDGKVVRVFRFAPAPSQPPQDASTDPADSGVGASAQDAPGAAVGPGIGNSAPSEPTDRLVHMWGRDESGNPTDYALCDTGDGAFVGGKIAGSTWQVNCPKCEEIHERGAEQWAEQHTQGAEYEKWREAEDGAGRGADEEPPLPSEPFLTGDDHAESES